MNKGFGGSQPVMRDTKIKNNDYLGTYPSKVSINDNGPFYLSEAKRRSTKFDQDTGKTSLCRIKKELLVQALEAKGVRAKGNKKAIVKLCQLNDIPFSEARPIVKEGWCGKPKGMLQVLFERGHIDPTIPNPYEHYTVDGKKDAFGNVIETTCLRQLIENQPDFIEEETLLQYHGRLLGAIVDRTPKCHPEMAGEGIEYSWGCAKGFYRRAKRSCKKTKENFRTTVRESLDREKVLTIERQRRFSKRARQYMLAYDAIQKTCCVENSEGEKNKKEMSAHLVESVIKQFKHKDKTYRSHRGADNQDVGYINSVVNEMLKGGSSK